MTRWRRFVRGQPELRAGGVLLLVGALGLIALSIWDGTAPPVDPAVAFTGHGFVSAVVAIMLVGVVAIGAVLLVLGALLWLIQKMRGSD